MLIGLEIEAQSPLALGFMKPYEWYHRTLDFIPGASFKGFIAEALLEECQFQNYKEKHDHCPSKDSCLFYSLFYKDCPCFFPLYPVRNCKFSLPMPKTAMSCKFYPGFATQRREKREEERHGVVDIIFRGIIHATIGAKLPILLEMKCQKCTGELKAISGFFETDSFKEYAEVAPEVSQLTRTALNRKTATVEKGMLYSIEAIKAGTRFYGEIGLQPANFQVLKDALENKVAFRARLGGGGTKGYGKVRVIEMKDFSRYDFGDITQRLDSFNSAFKKEAKPYVELSEEDPISGWLYFSIDLLSDAILEDEVGAPITRITPQLLKGQFDEFEKVELEYICGFSSPITLSGWSTAWKLPKPVELCVEKGSVFVFRAKESEALIKALSSLEQEGIGEGRKDGLGRVIICHPFHFNLEVK